MTRNDGFREFAGYRWDRVKSAATPPKPELNHPVPVDEFDRERMGIASKE